MGEIIQITGLSNREFIERYATAGRVGLSGGTTIVDRAICRAERHLDAKQRWGVWSHAFLFEGVRVDGQHWVVESDIQLQRKHIQLGVQENRIAKYYDESLYASLAVLDFGLTAAQIQLLISESLDLVASREQYSLRELFGTLFALKRGGDQRGQANVLARDRSVFCSSFIRHLFLKAGLDLAPGVDMKNTTPEDIAKTLLPHTAWVLKRELPRSVIGQMGKRIKLGVKSGIRQIKRRTKSA